VTDALFAARQALAILLILDRMSLHQTIAAWGECQQA